MKNRNPESGVALVAAMLFAIIVLGLVSAVIMSGTAFQKQARQLAARQGAQHAAESAVHLCAAQLSGPNAEALLTAGSTQGTIQGTGDRAPKYIAALVRAGTDGADNDLDGLIDEADEADMVEVTCSGFYDDVMRTVRVTLLARYRTPSFPSATYIADPFAGLDFNGNSFEISGYDVDLNGDPTGLVVPGIGVNGDPSGIAGQIAGNQEDNVIGAGGTPSVVEVGTMDLQDLVEEGARSPDVVLEGSSTYQPSEEGEWGTLDAPAILYAPGSVHISGGSEGSGILIVNGNLIITGGFEWRGMIIVRGVVDFRGGGGGKRLIGALVVEEDFFTGLEEGEEGEEEGGSGVEMSGTIDIIFSEQTITRVSQSFASYTILNWREGPNPDYEALP